MAMWETAAAGHRVSGRVPLEVSHKTTEVDRASWSRCRLFRCGGRLDFGGWPAMESTETSCCWWKNILSVGFM